MIGSSCPNPNPNPASAAPSSSSSSAPCGGGGGGSGSGGDAPRPPMASSDPRVPLLNLAALGRRMESLRRFLADPGDHRSPIADAELRGVSAEIASAVQQIILNGAALLASSHPLDLVAPLPPPDPPTNAAPIASDSPDPPLQAPPPPPPSVPTAEPLPGGGGGGGGDDRDSEESEIVEIEAEELLAEHIHFCEICGKGFKRDANLRMHMRAHGDRFKTLEALSGSGRTASAAAAAAGPAGRKPVRFSCPFPGCNRNRAHRRFRPLKSAVCVKNHFKRSHCPKMFSCHRCNKKSFSVLADLRSHLKHCGETPWRCSCGTSFSRKDKLFGHLALFEGHFPAVGEEAAATGKRKEPDINRKAEGPSGGEGFDPDFFEGLMDEFEGISEGNWPAR